MILTLDRFVPAPKDWNDRLRGAGLRDQVVMGILASPDHPEIEPFVTMERSSKMIPVGYHPIKFTASKAFPDRRFPLVPEVYSAKRTGIRFHNGSRMQDSQGCILCGMDTKNWRQIGMPMEDVKIKLWKPMIEAHNAGDPICLWVEQTDKVYRGYSSFRPEASITSLEKSYLALMASDDGELDPATVNTKELVAMSQNFVLPNPDAAAETQMA